MRLPAIDRRWWVALNISIGVYMSTLDASIVNISLPTIVRSLETDLRTVAWVVMAYLIVITGCLLLMGRLADLVGHRRIYLFGFITFTVGSVLCGVSPTIHFLIGSRMLQGLGASATMAIGPAIITSAFAEKDRGQALGLIGSIVSLGFITGPLLGGFLVEHVGWRSVFFINLPIGMISIYLSLKVLEKGKPAGKVRIDFWGGLLLFVFLTFFLLCLNRVGYGCLFISLVSLGLFVIVELRSPFPLVDLRLFRNRPFIASLGASLFSFWMNSAHIFVIPFFLQKILSFSPSKVGLMVFPVALTVMVMAPLGGRISDRVGIQIPANLGLVVTSITIFSFTYLRADATDLDILWRQVFLGIGIGLFNPANNSAIIGSLPKGSVGLASSFLGLARNLGMVIGVAFAEMVISFKLPPSQMEKGGSLFFESIQDVWKLVLAVGLTALILSWIRQKRSGH